MNARRTYLTYFGFLLLVFIAVGYSARNVIFRPWTARSWVVTSTLDKKIYVFGGKNGQNELVKDALVIDPVQNSLRRAGGQPTSLFGSSAASLGGTIYLAGGTDLKSISDEILRFDTATHQLTAVGRLTGPRTYGALVSVSGGLYYLGGWDGKSTSNEILRYDPTTAITAVVGHLPFGVEQFAAVGADGLIYVFGGMNAAGDFVSDIYSIDPENGSVRYTGRLPAPAARVSATSLNGTIYISGGWNGTELRNLLSLTPGVQPLVPKVVREIGYPILDASLAASGNRLYLVGGKEERYGRQVQVLRIDPESADVTSVLLRSYAWR